MYDYALLGLFDYQLYSLFRAFGCANTAAFAIIQVDLGRRFHIDDFYTRFGAAAPTHKTTITFITVYHRAEGAPRTRMDR